MITQARIVIVGGGTGGEVVGRVTSSGYGYAVDGRHILMTIETPLSLCIINGYPKLNRDVLAGSNVTQAHDLYLDFLNKMVPNGNFDILYVADSDVGLPEGASLQSYHGYIWTGSNLTLYHDVPEVSRQIALARAIYEAGVPQFGSCWGVQMAAMAAGGEVKKNPRGREWSIARDITLSPEGQVHPMYTGKPSRFDGFIMHLDEVTRIPPGGTLLACNEHTPVQALAVKGPGGGEFWATQYHPEFTLFEMARLLGARKAALVKEGFFQADKDVEILADKMIALSKYPAQQALRNELNLHDDILDDNIRQAEVRNWLRYLVIPRTGSSHLWC
jgi:GMP synthase (glutamine-hydrolysing)